MHFPLLYLEAEWRGMEQRQTGGKADEWVSFFLNGRNVSSMLRGVRKGRKRDGGREVDGWRGAKEEPADFW